MAEQLTHIKADSKKRSLFQELAKDAMEEVIVPKSRDAMRNMSDDIFTMFLEVVRNIRDGILYPDGNIPNRKPMGGGGGTYSGVTNYTSFSRPINSYQSNISQGRKDLIGQRPGNEVDYVWVWSEEDAKSLLGFLKERIDNYGKAKVSDLYEKIGRKTTISDFNFGWTDSNSFGFYYDHNRRHDEAPWFIDLPKPVDIRDA